MTNDFEDRHEILLSKMKNVVIEEVEVKIDDKERTYMLAEVFAFNDLSHQVIWYF